MAGKGAKMNKTLLLITFHNELQCLFLLFSVQFFFHVQPKQMVSFFYISVACSIIFINSTAFEGLLIFPLVLTYELIIFDAKGNV